MQSAEKGNGVTRPGAAAKANVGISNDKRGEKPLHRKAKGSRDNVNQSGVSQGLSHERERGGDGEPVNIPALKAGGFIVDGGVNWLLSDGIGSLISCKAENRAV